MKPRGHGTLSGSGSGATLIEVVITVGILITTLVPLLGLLSAAIDMSGKAVSANTAARISAKLVGDVQQGDWLGLLSWSDRDVYFDDQGCELTGANAQAEAVYSARVTLGPVTGVSMGTIGIPNPSLRQVMVVVSSRPGVKGRKDLDDAKAAITDGKKLPMSVRVTRAMLVNLEKPT
ncbi:uncharacterized protein (TIGR02598 family) [Roseimicrobium gellanilyticum]|uniref:Uncharacterized protein (TIGR02598 family) n=1 Tax=Roseimicrobium gellanilyticum TaxID=748857 RepID=A0A366HIR4_9BACT|nr:Verru_Chthon cassette protein B [Roseimicrobium gellanilyticum]RBP42646.1 uncharacterized protein (TIGR02598 family) [Roseimicrobium gellanilyticum]